MHNANELSKDSGGLYLELNTMQNESHKLIAIWPYNV